MSTILVICPTQDDQRELSNPRFRDYTFVFDDYTCEEIEKSSFGASKQVTDPRHVLRTIEQKYGHIKFDAVIATDDYPGIILASIIAKKNGLRSPEPEMCCFASINIMRDKHSKNMFLKQFLVM